MSVLIKDNLNPNSSSSGSENNKSTKQKFREALKLTDNSKTKAKKAKMNTKKSDIEYSAIFNTKDDTSSGDSKSNPHKQKPKQFLLGWLGF